MTELLDSLVDVAREAARVILEVYDTAFDVDFKAPKDPVTAADRRANDLICARLAERHAGVPIVAEESDPSSYGAYQDAPRVFFVDPLDGTAEFVKRNDEFAVMIGLVDGERAVAGVVLSPVERVAWAGEVGHGAWRIDPDGRKTPIRVSETASLDRACLVASRSHRTERLEQALTFFGARDYSVLGSAGLKGAAVARGAADAYVSPGRSGKRWDACASDALITAAGGRFTDGFGDPITYRSDSIANERGMVATNRRLHDAILERLEALRQRS